MGYSNDGIFLFEKDEPEDLKFLYLSVLDHYPSLVCEVDTIHADFHGRSTYHFKIEKTNGELIKVGMAY